MLSIFLSCGQNSPSEEMEQFSLAKKELNSRNYSKANELLISLTTQHPNNKKYKQLLADSYLGLGGFELYKFLFSIEKLTERSFKTEDILKELKSFVAGFISITNVKKENLSQALNIYNQLDINEESSKEEKLKKGLVHIFLLTQSLKDLVMKIEDMVEDNKTSDLEAFYKKFVYKYIVHIDEMIFHSFSAYSNFKNSFAEVLKLLSEIDRAMKDVFGTPYNEIREEFNDMNIEKFAVLFIKYNPEIYKEVMLRLFNTCNKVTVLKKISILERTIISDYNNHSFKNHAYRMIKTVKEYVNNHDENICNNYL